MSKGVVLTIGGSDPSGGAGIQADIKTAERLGVYPCAVITAITAQNSSGVTGVWALEPSRLQAQLESVLEDFDVSAVKTGLIATKESVEIISHLLIKYNVPNIVVDPVLSATMGSFEAGNGVIEAIGRQLFPIATIVTPNIPEKDLIEKEMGEPIASLCDAYLLKGGHSEGDVIIDRLYYKSGAERDVTSMPSTAFPTLNFGHSSLFDHDSILPSPMENEEKIIERSFTHPRVETSNTHGSGCVLSSAIACLLAKGHHLDRAVDLAIRFTANEIKNSSKSRLTKGPYGPTLS